MVFRSPATTPQLKQAKRCPSPAAPCAAAAMGCVMDELSAVSLILFVSATFAASFVAGLAGFAFAIVAAAVWLHFLPPTQSTVLTAAFGLIVQGWAVWKLRQIGRASCR